MLLSICCIFVLCIFFLDLMKSSSNVKQSRTGKEEQKHRFFRNTSNRTAEQREIAAIFCLLSAFSEKLHTETGWADFTF